MGKFEKGHTLWNKNKGDKLLTIKVTKNSDGYRRVIKTKSGTSHNYVSYSRYLMEKKIGRKLDKSEIVHHIDGNKLNDSLNNLKIINRKEHASHHRKGKKPVEAIKKASELRKEIRNRLSKKVIKIYNQTKSLRKTSSLLNLSRNLITKIVRRSK